MRQQGGALDEAACACASPRPGEPGGAEPRSAASPVGSPAPYDSPAWRSQVYAGYSEDDLRVFEPFAGLSPEPSPGFITDFLGVRMRAAFLRGLSLPPEGQVMGLPVPGDSVHAETVEWVGLLQSVLAARGRLTVMELGAGWGPWVVAAAAAGRRLGIEDFRLTAVEADPGHFEFLRQHFVDNGLDPAQHRLVKAAVGAAAGRARWPVCEDPAADWGSRPVTDATGACDHLGRAFGGWLDVEVVAFDDLLSEQPAWDLVHVDVQGWELDLCRSAIPRLNERVRRLVVATHDYALHGLVMELMHAQGWMMENEKPPRVGWRDGAASLQAMMSMDGTQVWRNPAIGTGG